MSLVTEYEDVCTQDDFSLDTFFAKHIEDYSDLKKTSWRVSMRDYFAYTRDVFKPAARVEGPCIAACEIGEVGGQALLPFVTTSTVGVQVGSLGLGAVLGGAFAASVFLGEHEMHEHAHSLEDMLEQQTLSYQLGRTKRAFVAGAKQFKNIATRDPKKRAAFYTNLKEAASATLYTEVFGCIAAAELTALGVSHALGGTALSVTNPLFWGIWGFAMIPAFFAGTTAVALKLGADAKKKSKQLVEFHTPKGNLDTVYTTMQNYFECSKIKKRQFHFDLPDGQRVLVKKRTPDTVRSLRDLSNYLGTVPFRAAHKGNDLYDITCKGLKKDDPRKAVYQKVLEPMMQELAGQIPLEHYATHSCGGDLDMQQFRHLYGERLYMTLDDAVAQLNAHTPKSASFGESLKDGVFDLKKGYKQLKKLRKQAKKQLPELANSLDTSLKQLGKRSLLRFGARQSMLKGSYT